MKSMEKYAKLRNEYKLIFLKNKFKSGNWNANLRLSTVPLARGRGSGAKAIRMTNVEKAPGKTQLAKAKESGPLPVIYQ